MVSGTEKICSAFGVPKELLEKNSTFINADEQVKEFKMQYLCEWVKFRCPKCNSEDIQVTEQVTGCNDCGWHDA